MQNIPIDGHETLLHFNRFTDTEVIDLFNGTHYLPKYGNHPYSFYGATGAFIKNKLLLCGGYEYEGKYGMSKHEQTFLSAF